LSVFITVRRKVDMMMKKNTAIAVGALFIFLLVISLIIFSSKPVALEGNYASMLGGQYTGVELKVEENGSIVTFLFEGPNGLRALYQVPKARDNRYVLEENTGSNRTALYEIKRTKKGLEGVVWVIPAGRIEVLFEKKQQQNRVSQY
jgi:hypothetical protein